VTRWLDVYVIATWRAASKPLLATVIEPADVYHTRLHERSVVVFDCAEFLLYMQRRSTAASPFFDITWQNQLLDAASYLLNKRIPILALCSINVGFVDADLLAPDALTRQLKCFGISRSEQVSVWRQYPSAPLFPIAYVPTTCNLQTQYRTTYLEIWTRIHELLNLPQKCVPLFVSDVLPHAELVVMKHERWFRRWLKVCHGCIKRETRYAHHQQQCNYQ
jgi:hypothetical protein